MLGSTVKSAVLNILQTCRVVPWNLTISVQQFWNSCKCSLQKKYCKFKHTGLAEGLKLHPWGNFSVFYPMELKLCSDRTFNFEQSYEVFLLLLLKYFSAGKMTSQSSRHISVSLLTNVIESERTHYDKVKCDKLIEKDMMIGANAAITLLGKRTENIFRL